MLQANSQLEKQISPPEGRKIRVLHLVYSMSHAGLESMLLNWIRHTDPDRLDVFLCCFAGDRNREQALLEAASVMGVGPVHTIPWRRSKPVLEATRALIKLLDELEIDVLHTHVYYSHLVGALSRFARPKVKRVSTVYVWAPYDPIRFVLQMMDWIVLKFGFDVVTAHCEKTRLQTLRMGFPPSKVPLTITGFPDEVPPPSEETRRNLRKSKGIGEDEIILLNVARLYREKAHDQLLQSFKTIHTRYPKTRLWISGDGPLYQEVQDLIVQLGLQGAVEIIGFQFNLWPFLHSADIMVHPSHAEGVSIALQYGMAAGLPIVATAIGGSEEILQNGSTAHLVRENSIQEFADAVMQLIENPHERHRMGSAARQFLVENYSIEKACKMLETVYRNAIGLAPEPQTGACIK